MRFSANLGFLWTDLELPDAIRAAGAAGFDAVECHWPYAVAVEQVRGALEETGLPMLGLNTSRGDVASGENGLSALPGREDEARAAIDQALDYGSAIAAQNLHVMAGFAQGANAEIAFVDALTYACEKAAAKRMTILIEPLNPYDAPGYFLQTTDHAAELITRVGRPNLKLMFDCYHVQLVEGDVTHRLQKLMPVIGHIQIARVPDRGSPDGGELNYTHIFETLRDLGWDRPIGAEYKPAGPTEESLDWLKTARSGAV